MILIYLSTGAPGEGARAIGDAPDGADVFFRTARGYDGPESGAERVYANDQTIQTDYEAAGAEVRTLSGEVVIEGSGSDDKEHDKETVAEDPLKNTAIGGTALQDASKEKMYEIAQKMGIDGRSTMKKDELYQAIKEEKG